MTDDADLITDELAAHYSVLIDVRALLVALVKIQAHACPHGSKVTPCDHCTSLADEATRTDPTCDHHHEHGGEA